MRKTTGRNIFILHPGKADYPEINAYRDFFSARGWFVEAGGKDEYRKKYGAHGCDVLWCIMGFYPENFRAKMLIHDYRSLSTGSLVGLKDFVKKKFNVKPHLRIFQNEKIKECMGFNDNINSLILPMGVPDWIFRLSNDEMTDIPNGRFCYVGAISEERGIDRLILDYLDAGWNGDGLILIGEPEKKILEAYKSAPGVTFTGRLPQEKALQYVLRSDFAICPIPYHRPFSYQTPTKLLEYAALGKKIICNDSPSNIAIVREFGIKCIFTGKRMFLDLDKEKLANAEGNIPKEFECLLWSEVINSSKIEAYLS